MECYNTKNNLHFTRHQQKYYTSSQSKKANNEVCHIFFAMADAEVGVSNKAISGLGKNNVKADYHAMHSIFSAVSFKLVMSMCMRETKSFI